MKFALYLLLIVPVFAFATPKMNVVQCFYERDSSSEAWKHWGWSSADGYYELPEGETDFFAFWTTTFGHCTISTGTSGDALDVSAYLFEGEDIQFIDENCNAQGTSVHSVVSGQKRIARGESLDISGTFGDGSQVLMHILFTPYEHLSDQMSDFAKEYCSTRTP